MYKRKSRDSIPALEAPQTKKIKQYSTLTLTTAYLLLKNIAENKIDFDVCNISPDSHSIVKLMSKAESIEKTSSSPSEVLFGKLIADTIDQTFELPVSIKIFLNNDNPDVLGLKYEAQVYYEILNEIINKNYSPNFVSFVGYGCCSASSIENIVNPGNVNLKKFAQNGACITITEKVGNGTYFGLPGMYPVSTLHEIISRITSTDKAQIMFQIIYALEVLQRYKIVHNDLHTNNILVVHFPDPIRMSFQVGERYFVINTKYVPYLFDWDLSYAESLGDNQKLVGNFEAMNIRNKFDQKTDLYTLFCTIKEFAKGTLGKGARYNQPVTAMKEKNLQMPLTEEEAKKIMEFELYADYKEPVWKFTGNQIREIIPGKFPDDITNIMVTITRGRDYFIVRYDPVTNQGEEKIPITRKQVKKIVSYGPFIKDGKKVSTKNGYVLYRLPGKYMMEAVPDKFPENPGEYIFYIDFKENKDSYLQIYNPYPCRITVASTNFPTPMDLLQNEFNEFVVPEVGQIRFSYSLPGVPLNVEYYF